MQNINKYVVNESMKSDVRHKRFCQLSINQHSLSTTLDTTRCSSTNVLFPCSDAFCMTDTPKKPFFNNLTPILKAWRWFYNGSGGCFRKTFWSSHTFCWWFTNNVNNVTSGKRLPILKGQLISLLLIIIIQQFIQEKWKTSQNEHNPCEYLHDNRALKYLSISESDE